MNRLWFVSIFLGVILSFAVPVHAGTQDFIIPSFTADYYLSRDKTGVSQMLVQEEIIAEFPEIDQNHGILRALPQRYDGHSLEVTILNVRNAQNDRLQYEQYTENGNLVLRIGNSDVYVHGRQVYKIDYSVRGIILDQVDHQELYWDVNGDQWYQPMTKVQARVHLSDEIKSQLIEQKKCYTGILGATNQDCVIAKKESVFSIETTGALEANQTLTFAIGFTPGTFKGYSPSEAQIKQWILLGVAIALPPIVALIIVIRNWYKFGRDPAGKGTIVPEYLPPKDVSVMQSSAVLKEGFENKAISAQIIDLAVRHYVKVYELKTKKFIGHKTEYELELIGNSLKLRPEERKVVSLVFGSETVGSRRSLSKTDSSFVLKALRIGSQINKDLVTEGYFRIDPALAKTPYIIAGIVIGFAGFFFLPWGWGCVVAGAVLGFSSVIMPARTNKGVALREYLLGLKMYMQLAESERIKILQSPQGRLIEKINVGDKRQLIKLYEHLLPYAMLFGIEKEWTKEFVYLYSQEPRWYHGSGTFNAALFAESVTSFTTASNANFAPSGSGGGGFSGSAGGGGGGGGGGGW